MAPKRPRPRAPFVVTFALAAAAGACGGSTSSDSGSGGGEAGGAGGAGGGPTGGSGGGPVGGSGGFGNNPGGGGCGANPPSIPCPGTPPPEGSACPTDPGSCFGMWWGTTCYYPDPCGGTDQLVMDCSGTSWKVESGTLTCKCPASAPVVGAPCAVAASETCSYSAGCCSEVYQCLQGKWSQVPVSCNPPPLICPSTPPAPGAPCDPCAMTGECSYDTCAALGKLTKASCVSGSWSVSGAPCAVDAGTD